MVDPYLILGVSGSLVLRVSIKMQENELCVNFYTHVLNTKLKIKDVEAGSVTFTNVPNGDTAPWISKQIDFSVQFDTPPWVIIVPQMAAWMYLHQVGNVTSSGCTIRVRNFDSTSNATIPINYIAINLVDNEDTL